MLKLDYYYPSELEYIRVALEAQNFAQFLSATTRTRHYVDGTCLQSVAP